MGIFSQKEEIIIEEERNFIIEIPSNGSIISKCSNVEGEIKSCEPVIIKGKFQGRIVCEDIVVICESGEFKGEITAKEIRVDGVVKAPLKADLVEITKNAEHAGYIICRNSVIDGRAMGDILCSENLEILENGLVVSQECRAETAIVEGKIKGYITVLKLLDVKAGALVDGKIEAKELKIENGSKISGVINKRQKPKKEGRQVKRV